MSTRPQLKVTKRQGTGSGVARKLRRAGQIPAVLYGHGDPVPVAIDLTEFRHHVSPAQYGSIVVNLFLDGVESGAALVKTVQANPLRHTLLSVELQRVALDDRISVIVPIELHGEPAGARAGGVLEQAMHALNLRCRAGDVPAHITYDVSMLQVGDTIHTAQLALPAQCELLGSAEDVVAVMLTPTVPATEEPVVITSETGPELTGEREKTDVIPAEG